MVKDKESSHSISAIRGNYALEPVSDHCRMEEDVYEPSYQVMGCLWPCTRAQWESLTGWSGWWCLQSRGYWEALRDTQRVTHKNNNLLDGILSPSSPLTQKVERSMWQKGGDEWDKRQKHAERVLCVSLRYHERWAVCAVGLHQLHWWPGRCISQNPLVLPL